MRSLHLIGAGAVCAVGVWWFARTTKAPVAVNSVPGQNNDYLNFDFNNLLFPFGDSQGDTMQDKPYQTGDNAMLPRGVSNKNPLNIEANGINWQGMTGNDGRFAIFETDFYGIRAAARVMKTYRDKYQLNTVQGIVNRWAPSHENPTNNYVQFVAKNAGVSAQQTLSMADYPKVISAMIHFENGYNPYDEKLIYTATAAGFE